MSRGPGTGPRPSARTAAGIRLVLSPLILGLVLAVLWLHDHTGNPLPTDLLLFVAGAAAAWEMVRLLQVRAGPLPAPGVALAAGLLAGVGLLAPANGAVRFELRVALLVLALVGLYLLALRDTRPETGDRIALAFLPVVWVGLFLSLTREAASGPDAARTLAWIALVAKASDMGGWLVGMPFGRHKMIPSVSPGKSWEGLAGGLAASALVALFLPALLGIDPAAWSTLRRLLFGLVVGGAAVLAGVFHSAWKRRLGAKDSSVLIPEMGGVLDMVDSLLLAGPAAWAWIRLGL